MSFIPDSRSAIVYFWVVAICFAITVPTGCHREKQATLRLGVTTSVRDSGLLDQLLPTFEKQHATKVQVIASGTGAILELARKGEIDAIIVHSKKDEVQLVADGYSNRRNPIMKNSFILLGPQDDPARVGNLSIVDAFRKLQEKEIAFVSRGDSSGTHKKELAILASAKQPTGWKNYLETGQGMGATLIVADQKKSYTLCDRGTYLNFKNKIELVPIVTDGALLDNPYSALVINSATENRRRAAAQLIEYLLSENTQNVIENYRIDGQNLFTPIRKKQPSPNR